jgi:hypothetical protein
LFAFFIHRLAGKRMDLYQPQSVLFLVGHEG